MDISSVSGREGISRVTYITYLIESIKYRVVCAIRRVSPIDLSPFLYSDRLLEDKL